MKTEKDYLNLVGRYERNREELPYRDESDDLHVIAVDFEEKRALVDFAASPDWCSIEEDERGHFLIDRRFRLFSETMHYELLV